MTNITRQQIIEQIGNDKQYRQICRNIVNSQPLFDFQNTSWVENDYLTDELYSEFLLSVCEIPEKRLLEIYELGGNHLKYYLLKVLTNQYKSDSSRYYREIKKKYSKYVDYYDYDLSSTSTYLTEMEEEWLPFLHEKIEKLHWFDRTIYSMYMIDNLSMRQISEKTDIKEGSIRSTISRVNFYLKEEVLKETNKEKETIK